jgi:hypothetical protein
VIKRQASLAHHGTMLSALPFHGKYYVAGKRPLYKSGTYFKGKHQTTKDTFLLFSNYVMNIENFNVCF